MKYAVFRTNAYGERPQTIFKTQNLHFCTILRWEPFHFSHPTVFRHPELDSGSQGRGLSTSIWRFRNKFGMTAYFRHPAIKQPQTPPLPRLRERAGVEIRSISYECGRGTIPKQLGSPKTPIPTQFSKKSPKYYAVSLIIFCR